MQLPVLEYQRRYGHIKRECVVCRETFRKHPRITYARYLKQKYCSRKCKGIAHAHLMTGQDNPNYVNGQSKEANILRGSNRYKNWRMRVFKFFGFRCYDCGEKSKVLHAHHLYPFAIFPRLRFDINNGVALCEACHEKTPTYKLSNPELKLMYGIK